MYVSKIRQHLHKLAKVTKHKLMAKQSILAILNLHRNIFANYIKNKDKSSRPTKLPNFLYFDNENIGNSPKRKRKLDISEKNTPTAKK